MTAVADDDTIDDEKTGDDVMGDEATGDGATGDGATGDGATGHDVTDRAAALRFVSSVGASGVITRDELTAAYEAGRGSAGVGVAGSPLAVRVDGVPGPPPAVPSGRLGIAEVLSYLGGAVVVIGVATLIGQNWHALSLPTRLLATLGAGVAAFVVGVLLSNRPQTDRAAPAFYLISGLVTPIGIAVLQDGADLSPGSNGSQSVNALAMLVAFGAAFYLLRRMVLLVLTVGYGVWLFFAVTGTMRDLTPWAQVGTGDGTPNFDAYRLLVVGVALGVLGYGLHRTVWKSFSGTLYGFGSLGLLVAVLVLGGWPPSDSLFWNLAFPVVDLGVLFAGVHLRSRVALTMGTLGLMGYLLKLTSEYFSDSLGWPLALVLAGLGMILIGFVSVMLRRRYLPSSAGSRVN